jgi:6-phosphogluconate dehydrogenase
MSTQEFGVVGLEVMGRNIALNIERNGFPVAVYNRTYAKTEDFMQGPAAGKQVKAAKDLREFCALIKRPRRVLLMVKAGYATDATIESIKPFLEDGDILIDGGNSLFTDTERRAAALKEHGIRFFGMGVSGGEEGALWGPSIMPGGDPQAYEVLKPVLEKIAAKAPSDGLPCVAYCGIGGAGHFVKMVHNGIEYGDMQLIAEAYDLLKNVGGLSHAQLHDVFAEWNRSELQSFLIEITEKVINFPDPDKTGKPLVEMIVDKVGMKGTGTWTIQNALQLQVPVPTMAAAVDARTLSSMKEQRIAAEQVFGASAPAKFAGDIKQFIADVKAALYCSKICSYAQGLALLTAANRPRPASGTELDSKSGWGFGIKVDEMARIWRAGCIIRAQFLDEITQVYKSTPNLPNLLVAEKFANIIKSNLPAWRRVVGLATSQGVATPAFSGSLAYFDAYRKSQSPGNLIQAQRDFFGGHTYQRTDRPGTFHTEWSGSGQQHEVVEGKARTGTESR